MDKILEVCTDDFEATKIAVESGADRIELCGNLIIGGTTPSPVLFEQIKNELDIEIKIMIRPRFGDFCYTDYEFEEMLGEIKLFKELGASEIVIGCLDPDGRFDYDKIEKIIDIAGGMQVSIHRAIDVCAEPLKSIEKFISLGIKTVLTSGGKAFAPYGIELLKEFKKVAGEKIEILAGGGVNALNIAEIYNQTGITSFHMSGRESYESPMNYRNSDVNMGLSSLSEYTRFTISQNKIRAARNTINQL